jgi:hypothetical protein
MNIISDAKKVYLTPSGARVCDSMYSNLKFNVPQLFPKDKFTLYHTIKVLHCEIPFSWYIVNSFNDQLVLSTGTITLTHGNYNANTFMTYLQTVLPTNMTISFNTSTGIFSFTYSTSFSILSTTTCFKLIGGVANTTYSSSSNVINMPNPANFLGTKNVYINVPNIILDNYNTESQTYNTLLCIAVNVAPYGVIFYDNRTSSKNMIKGTKDDSIDLQILDDDNNEIDFNSIEWSITLEIETVKQVIYYNNSSLNE